MGTYDLSGGASDIPLSDLISYGQADYSLSGMGTISGIQPNNRAFSAEDTGGSTWGNWLGQIRTITAGVRGIVDTIKGSATKTATTDGKVYTQGQPVNSGAMNYLLYGALAIGGIFLVAKLVK